MEPKPPEPPRPDTPPTRPTFAERIGAPSAASSPATRQADEPFTGAAGPTTGASRRARLNAFYQRHRRLFAVVFLLLVFLAALAVSAWWTCGFEGCPDPSTLSAYQPDGTSLLLDRHGEPFAELTPLEAEVVPLEDLPEHVPEAFVAVEDRRFFEHGGVDWVRLGGALRANLRAGGMREGGSTITMQLTRNLFSEQIPPGERTLERKILEMRVARSIEEEFAKDEILELYLNHIYFGHGARGIEAASRYYFGHPAAELSLPEAAMLAALPKAPAHYDPREDPEAAEERRNLVLELMAEQGRIGAEEAAAAVEADLGVVPKPPSRRRDGERLAPYFAEAVRRELDERFGSRLQREPVRVWTTLDLAAQRAAEEALASRLQAVERGALGRLAGGDGEDDGPLQAALVLLDARQGDVLAWVGGRDFETSEFDRVSHARRQPGSAFKPFVLAAALEAGRPLSGMVEDRPLTVKLSGGRTWTPENFRDDYDGQLSVRDALVWSKNVAFVRLAQDVGTRRVARTAEALGIEPPIPDEPSMALGTVDVSPLEMATAYSAFANLGEAVEPRLVLRVERPDGELMWESEPQRERVLEPAVAYLVNDVLQDVVRRGTGRGAGAAGADGVLAGKTGTTNGNHDAWFVGYTPRWVGAVWFGYDTPRSIGRWATGGGLAAPLWGRALARLQEHAAETDGEGGGASDEGWPRPSGIVERTVDPATGQPIAAGCEPTGEPTRTELFLVGTLPPARCPSFGDRTLTADAAEGFGADGLSPEARERLERLREQERREGRLADGGAGLEGDEPWLGLDGGSWDTEREDEDAPGREDEAGTEGAAGAAREGAIAEGEASAPGAPTDGGRSQEWDERLEELARARQAAADEREEARRAREREPERRERRDASAEAAGTGSSGGEGSGAGPTAPPSNADPGAAPEAGRRAASGRDLGGWWQLRTRIRESGVDRYEGLTLGFRVHLRQEGGRLVGRGEKWSEGGETLPAGRRTPIALEGTVDGREVWLTFSEQGAERASSGALRLRLAPDRAAMTGTFESSAAASRGTASLVRVP